MIHLYQVYYDEVSKGLLDPALTALDNSTSSRPDWFEYWPMRLILMANSFADEDYLGIFSPRFVEKTGLTGAMVRELVAKSDAEVIAFSPSFTQIALYQNSFFQGEPYQPGLLDVSQQLFEAIDLPINLKNLWADQTRSIFSNYFVAKGRFWKTWFSYAERIFDICEKGNTPLAARLTAPTRHRGTQDKYQMKVFIVERLVNALLETLNIDASSNFNFPYQRDLYNAEMKRLGHNPLDFGGFLLLDALKGAFIKTKQPQYLTLFRHHLPGKRA
jgi:hypothetical protein